MAAQILPVCDAVVDLIAGAVDPAQAVPQRVYSPNDAFTALANDTVPRKVRVFPMAYGDLARVTKSHVETEYKVAIAVEAVYKDPAQNDPAGRVPIEWVDAEVNWFHDNVYELVNKTGVRLATSTPLLGNLRPITCEVTVVYDPERLDRDKMFWSVAEVSYNATLRG